MSFAGLLVHDLTIVHAAQDGAEDEYNLPTAGTVTQTAVKGMVQPKTAREVADSRSAGAHIGEYSIFLEPMALDPADAILFGGFRYEITGVRDLAFGSVPHLEVDARRIGPIHDAEVLGS